MAKNPLLLGWVMDTKDDCFPYYFSKLEFLEMYGKQCSSHAGDCKAAKTEKECNVKRTLKCTYTEGECVQVIDSICNYYDKNGKVKEEEWGEEQVSYIDDLYKTAVNTKFGEFMLGKDYDKTVKTTAFQLISDKFNNIEYVDTLSQTCASYVKNVLMGSSKFLNELFDLRSRAYKEMANSHSQPFTFTPHIKNSELAVYVFELLKIKKCGNYKTIFTHDKDDDNKIYGLLTKGGVCFQEEHANNKTSSFFNLANFDKDDFGIKESSTSYTSLLWKVGVTVFTLAKNSSMRVGSILISILKTLKNILYEKISDDILIKFIFNMILIVMILFSFTTYLINSQEKYIDKIIFSQFQNEIMSIIYPLIKIVEILIQYFIGIGIVKYLNKTLFEDTENNKLVMKYLTYFIKAGMFHKIGLSTVEQLYNGKFNMEKFSSALFIILLSPILMSDESISSEFIKSESQSNIFNGYKEQFLSEQHGKGINLNNIGNEDTLNIGIKRISMLFQINLDFVMNVYHNTDGFTYLKAFIASLYKAKDNTEIIFKIIPILISEVCSNINNKAAEVLVIPNQSSFIQEVFSPSSYMNIVKDILNLLKIFLTFDPLIIMSTMFENYTGVEDKYNELNNKYIHLKDKTDKLWKEYDNAEYKDSTWPRHFGLLQADAGDELDNFIEKYFTRLVSKNEMSYKYYLENMRQPNIKWDGINYNLQDDTLGKYGQWYKNVIRGGHATNPAITIIKLIILGVGIVSAKKGYDMFIKYKNNKTNKNIKSIKSVKSSPKSLKQTKTIKQSQSSPSSPLKSVHNSLMGSSNSIKSLSSQEDKTYKRCPNGKHRNKSTKRCQKVEK